MESISHLIRHVKMCKNTDLQVHGTSSFLSVYGSHLKGLGKVLLSKSSFRGIF